MDVKNYLKNRDLIFFLLTSLISWQILRFSDCCVDSFYPIVKKHIEVNDKYKTFIVNNNLEDFIKMMLKILIIIMIIFILIMYLN